MPNRKTFTNPSVAVDLAIMAVVNGRLKALLVKRPDGDVAGYAMPGGIVRIDTSLEETVERVLREKVGIAGIHFEQLATYGNVERDPRGRVISVVYLALCTADMMDEIISIDRVLADLKVDWSGEVGGKASALVDEIALPLAFDHDDILGDVIKRLRGKLDYSKIAFALLPKIFTLRSVQEIHEAILDRPLTKPPFRRKLLDRGLIQPTGTHETGGAYRPAAHYILKTEE